MEALCRLSGHLEQQAKRRETAAKRVEIATHPGVLSNAEDSRAKLETVRSERSLAVRGVMQLSVQRLVRIELKVTTTTELIN